MEKDGGERDSGTKDEEIKVDSLELMRPRSVGVEHVGLWAMEKLDFDRVLQETGLKKQHIEIIKALIIGSMACPMSEWSTYRWLQDRSGLGELIQMDFEAMSHMKLYRALDSLNRVEEEVEKRLFGNIRNIFGLTCSVTLYDEGTKLSHPGVYCLRTNMMDWSSESLWKTYVTLTDLEAVFRSLKSELGLRPIYHYKEKRCDTHLFITVLAYQFVQVIRKKLEIKGVKGNWTTIRNILSGQQRVTAVFRRKDGRTFHVRKATLPEARQEEIYNALGLDHNPGGTVKMVV